MLVNSWQQPPQYNGERLDFELAAQSMLQLNGHLPSRKELLTRPLQNGSYLDALTFFTDIKAQGLEVPTDLHVMHCIEQVFPNLKQQKSHLILHHINLSAVTLIDPRFHEMAEYLLAEAGWKARNICWEITELETSPNIPLVYEISQWLFRQGFGVALDDYEPGNAYEPLLKYPLPWLVKIDKSLLDSPATLSKTIHFLHQKGLEVVIEGVETLEHMQFCIKQGVEYAQGYYIGRPQNMPKPKGAENKSNELPEPDGVQP